MEGGREEREGAGRTGRVIPGIILERDKRGDSSGRCQVERGRGEVQRGGGEANR